MFIEKKKKKRKSIWLINMVVRRLRTEHVSSIKRKGQSSDVWWLSTLSFMKILVKAFLFFFYSLLFAFAFAFAFAFTFVYISKKIHIARCLNEGNLYMFIYYRHRPVEGNALIYWIKGAVWKFGRPRMFQQSSNDVLKR